MYNTKSLQALAGVSCLLIVAGFMCGCSDEVEEVEAGPSYADLVVTYNAELATLDRLEGKKEQLLQKLAAVGKPSEQDAMKLLGNLLAPVGEAAGDAKPGTPTDPNAALDQAIQQAQATNDAARGMLEALGTPGAVDPQVAKANEQERQRMTSELESLDKEIATQKQRVERARQARDAADTAAQKSDNSPTG